MAALPPRALDQFQAARFSQAMAFLRSGQPAQALRVAEVLAAQAPCAVDAWQLLGMCLASNGRYPESETAFERALALMPTSEAVIRNYAASLARHGKVLRDQAQFGTAEPILRKAVALSPELASAWVDLGVVLRFLGRAGDALVAFEKAEALLAGNQTGLLELQDAINGVLAEAGRPKEALARARALVSRHPAYVPGQETLSRLLLEFAPEEDSIESFRGAARAHPHDRALQLSLARTLVAAGDAEEALTVLHPLRKDEPDDPVLQWFAANAMEALRQYDEAGALYANAARGGLADLPEFLNARARHAFRVRDIELAFRCAEAVVRSDPYNQEGWCHIGTAWRLLGDAREYWLCDYDRLIGCIEVPAPPEYGSILEFLRALERSLDSFHTAKGAPFNQSVRGGTQTAGQLFGRGDRVIGTAQAALHAAVESWLATLPMDADHPFLSRRSGSVRFSGSWSVKLGSSGRHSNHIHPKGWISSAFYVALPDAVCESSQTTPEGWIQFGQPLEELELELSPRRIIRPEPGRLVLFPSYLWHGTVPFEAPKSRLTIAFDMQPG